MGQTLTSETNFEQEHLKYTSYHTYNEMIKLNLIVNFVKENQVQSILDVGCHTGNVSLPLAYMDKKVVGIDIDLEDIEEAQRRDKEHKVDYRHLDFMKVEDSFDLILFLDILEHVLNPQDYINQAYKLLNKSGSLIVSIPNGFGPYELFLDIPMLFLRKLTGNQMRTGEYHVQFFTVSQINKLTQGKFTLKKHHSFMFTNYLPFFNRSKLLSILDYEIAKKLPPQLNSRWLLILQKI